MHKAARLLPLALFAACSHAPPHVRPELPTPPAYPFASDSAAAAGARAIDIGWRDFFRDPRLGVLIATALENNRDLQVSVAQIEVARGFYRIQSAARLPEPVASADATRSHAGEAALGIPGAGGRTTDRLSVGVGVSAFELDFWGRVRNLSEAARSEFLATVQAQRAFRLSLIQDVASTYLSSVETGEEIRFAEGAVASRRNAVRIAQVRLRAGLTSALDFHQAESLLEQAEAALAGLRLTQAQLNNLLFVLVGGPVPQPLPEPL
jgi:multidrug efflux system outer membrane protein